jgi:hypothetical protein
MLQLYHLILRSSGRDIEVRGGHNYFKVAAQWALFSLLIMWCTTEISQKIFFDDLIFWIALGGGIGLGLTHGQNRELS